MIICIHTFFYIVVFSSGMWYVAIHDPWTSGHCTWLGAKMVVTPWLRKPALEDFLIDHMSDVCQTCQTFQAAFEILLTYHGSKNLPVFSVQLLICRLTSRPRHDLSVRLNGRTILRLVSDFSTPIHFTILPHPDMWFVPTASTLLSMIFRRHLSHSFPLYNSPIYQNNIPWNSMRFTSGPPWKSQRRTAKVFGRQSLQQGRGKERINGFGMLVPNSTIELLVSQNWFQNTSLT